MKTGKYVVFEGPDLVGKTTMAQMVKTWLDDKHNIESFYAQQPGSTNLGKQLRHIVKHEQRIEIGLETEALMFVLDQMAFVENIAIETLNSGKWIISDRNNYISGLVYQTLNGVSPSRIDNFYAIIPTPPIDIVFVLRADKSIASRAKNRDSDAWDRYENNKDFMDKVYEAYNNLWLAHGLRINRIAKECVYINADRSIEEVFIEIINHLVKLL